MGFYDVFRCYHVFLFFSLFQIIISKDCKNFSVFSTFSEKSITYIEGQSLVFSVPVESNGEINQVLAGVCKKENRQNLIAPQSLNGSGLSCIIDNNGKVVISPTDVKPFIQLDSIFMAKDENKTKNAIEEMKSHMSSGEPGVFNYNIQIL